MEITIIINLVYLALALVLYFVLTPALFIQYSDKIVYFAILLNFLFFGWYFGVEAIRSDLMDSLLTSKGLIDSQIYDLVFGAIEKKRISYVIPFLSPVLILGIVKRLKNKKQKLIDIGS